MPPLSVRLAKRAIDIAAASVGIAVTLPLYPLVAAAIRLDSKGPVFYKQRRAMTFRGVENGVPRCTEFNIYKFRTMRTDAEKHTGAVLASQNDARITRIGGFLRKSRIDELPQFFNVLMGQMSLVGPRPERPELLANLALAIPYFEERMRDVKPGITGLAQVRLKYTGAIPEGSELEPFRSTLQNPFDLAEAEGALADDMRAKLLYDLAYTASLEKFSTYLRTELEIIFKTPLVMLKAIGQ